MMIKSNLRTNIALLRGFLLLLGIIGIITIITLAPYVKWQTYIALLFPTSLIGFNIYNILNFKEIKISEGEISIRYVFRRKKLTYKLKQIKSYRRIYKDLNSDFDLSPFGQAPLMLKVKFYDKSSVIISSSQNTDVTKLEEIIKSTCRLKTRLKLNEYPKIYYLVLKKDTQYVFRPSLT